MSMLSCDEALRQLLAAAVALPGTEVEQLPLVAACGRVLAEDVVSAINVPPMDNSAMDGYALRSDEVAAAVAANVSLPVSQRIPAGAAAEALPAGSVARIFTGAPLPAGADAVVMQEEAQPEHDASPLGRVRFSATPAPGDFIRRAGEDIARGACVLPRGSLLGAAQLGLAAAVGVAELRVCRGLRVGLLATGNELVTPGALAPEALPPGAIFNSNYSMLSVLLQQLGCVVADLGPVADNLAATRAALRHGVDALRCDLLLSSGGVSVGEEDHVRAAVEQEGELALWKIAMKPGKPLAFGHVHGAGGTRGPGRTPFLGLPGNPVASFVTFALFVRPYIRRMQGVRADMPAWPQPYQLAAAFDWPRPAPRREFLRARRNHAGQLELYANQSSGVLTSVDWSEGLVDLSAGQTVRAGDVVSFLPFHALLT